MQDVYYDTLQDEYDIESKGVEAGVREIILKGRKEGFSSLALAIFAADDILTQNPTETLVISYKDDATKTFIKRYKNYVLSYYARRWKVTDPKKIFSTDNGNELILAHNGARFYCGTASARTAERGSTVHKLLFSEAAHYPDTDKMTAREIIEGTLNQMDLHGGICFVETTANGYGNHYEKMWSLAYKGGSRFKARFFGWQAFYTQDEYDLIYSQATDKELVKQEFPSTPEEAFIFTGSPYFDTEKIFAYMKEAPEPTERAEIELDERKRYTVRKEDNGRLKVWLKPSPYASYTIGGDVAQGIEGGDYSVLVVIDNFTLQTVAKWSGHVTPDEFAKVAYALGWYYNRAYMGIEVNADGLWVNSELLKMGYPNLYYREALDDITNRVGRKIGFKTDRRTRPYILAELRKLLNDFKGIWTNKDFLQECLTFVRNPLGEGTAMTGKHDDEIMATSIAYEIRRNAPVAFDKPFELDQNKENYVKMRLQKLYGKKKVVRYI